MPKLIDYPRTSYTSAWEVAEVVDDTGGKCALETCARKLNRKVSGSFKAIVGSAVKFGLLTSKREILTTTTLFRRIKHAYDKQEELVFHREAFLTPALFTQLCRKFRSRELPVAMLDVLLIREFDVEEINAQSVAKAFIDGARMVSILDEHNLIADIDQLAAQQPPRRELASPSPATNVFRQTPRPSHSPEATEAPDTDGGEQPESPASNGPESLTAIDPTETFSPAASSSPSNQRRTPLPPSRMAPAATSDAIASLFGLGEAAKATVPASPPREMPVQVPNQPQPSPQAAGVFVSTSSSEALLFRIQLAGPGINTQLDVVDADDLLLVRALLDKIERRLKQTS